MHALNLISTNHCTGYGFTSFLTVSVYFYMFVKTILGKTILDPIYYM